MSVFAKSDSLNSTYLMSVIISLFGSLSNFSFSNRDNLSTGSFFPSSQGMSIASSYSFKYIKVTQPWGSATRFLKICIRSTPFTSNFRGRNMSSELTTLIVMPPRIAMLSWLCTKMVTYYWALTYISLMMAICRAFSFLWNSSRYSVGRSAKVSSPRFLVYLPEGPSISAISLIVTWGAKNSRFFLSPSCINLLSNSLFTGIPFSPISIFSPQLFPSNWEISCACFKSSFSASVLVKNTIESFLNSYF